MRIQKVCWLAIGIWLLGTMAGFGQERPATQLDGALEKERRQLLKGSIEVNKSQVDTVNRNFPLLPINSSVDVRNRKVLSPVQRNRVQHNLQASAARKTTGGVMTTQSVETSDQDSLALVAFYNNLGGNGWDNNDNWLTGPVSSWHGVSVTESGRVDSLILTENNLQGSLPDDMGDLTALEVIDLLGNNLSGTIPSTIGNMDALREIYLGASSVEQDITGLGGEIPPEMLTLPALEVIYIYRAQLSGSIPSDLDQLSTLKTFFIVSNNFSGSIPSAVTNMTQLEVFNVSSNDITGSLPSDIGNLTNVRTFFVANAGLSGSIPPSITNMDSLRFVSFYNNGLTGQIPSGLDNLNKLQYLEFGENDMDGSIPAELGNLTDLYWLNLEQNNFTGTIPSELTNLANLEFLSFWQNDLEGELPDNIGNWTNMWLFSVSENQLTGSIPTSIGLMAELEEFHLVNNQFSGEIPAEIGQLDSLRQLEFQFNQLDGDIPAEMGQLEELRILNLEGNSLTGAIPVELGNLSKVQTFNLSQNQLTGQIPDELGNLTSVINLWIWNNQLEGEIPASLTTLANVEWLSLSMNQLSGDIPSEIGNLTTLNTLYLQSNEFTGSIPSTIGDLSNLVHLEMGDAPLTGSLPPELGNLSNLEELFIWGTDISGEIPSELGNLSNLRTLNLSTNKFTGTIPSELGNLSNLEFFGLYNNEWENYQGEISGEIPSELGNLTNLTVFGAYGQSLTGEIPASLGNLTNVEFFGLYQNELSGSIPSEITNMESMTYLGLGGNELTGSIPPETGNLSNLEHINLGGNQLTGEIPSELENLSFLGILNLAFNEFEGKIPSELGNLSNLRNIRLNDNQLSGPIPEGWGDLESLEDFIIEHNFFTSLPKLKDVTGNLWLDDLKLTFDDIVPNLDNSAIDVSYSPQKPFGEPQTVKAATGSTVELTPETSHPDNEYQWYKDGQAVGGATSKVLKLNDVSESDFGEYHVEVTNPNATDLTIESEPFTVEKYYREFEISYNSGWNLVSLPFDAGNGDINTHFPDANDDDAYSFSGSYNPATELSTNQGYWLKFDNGGTSEFEGDVDPDVEITLQEGWNLIGAPGDEALFADIEDRDDILVAGTLQGYDGAYQSSDALIPGRGYFVRASSGGTVTVSVKDAVKNKESRSLPVEEFEEIIVSNGTADQSLYINGSLNKDWSPENFSLPPVPPDPSLDIRIQGDYRLSEADSVTFDLVSSSYPVTLSLKNDETSESYYVSGIMDGKPGQSQSLSGGQEVTLQRPYEKIAVYTEKYYKSNLPGDYQLKPNYPNPFNPATNIQYQLPEQANVQVEVFDLLGRKVATLVNTEQQPGNHTVRFDASSMSSGMYFVRLKAGTFQQIQKITLIK